MTPGWSSHGARCRGALALLEQFQADGRKVSANAGGGLVIDPGDDLLPGDFHILRDLKPELLAWVAIPNHLREILQGTDPEVTLEALHRYREGLDLWQRFSQRERAILLPQRPTLNDLRCLDAIKNATGGSITLEQPRSCALVGNKLHPPQNRTAQDPMGLR